jgi:pimeloyl-ACP methyl ester carboxylesterase
MIIRASQNVETPVVFIPGILGSTLVEDNNGTRTERWFGTIPNLLRGSNIDRLLSQSPLPNIIATDAIRELPLPLGPVYKPILDSFVNDGELREYLVDGKPERRTFQGCDMNQRFSAPGLFVFAYDWRKSNIENADKLKEYVQCIQRFYPGTKIDIVAHSMGGLIGRRHIISNPNSHNVRKMVTVGSPFLGAPKALEVMETGRSRFLPDSLDKRIPTFLTNKIKTLVRESKSAHELFPSAGYFTLGGKPFVEETFDINADTIVPQIYNYQQTFDLFNSRFSNLQYTNNQTFHGVSGQDDWRLDTSGVEFFHIFGKRSVDDTVESITAKPISKKPLSVTRRDFRFIAKFGKGDGTVPILSAERIGNSNFNFAGATLRGYEGQNRSQDKFYEHTGLVKTVEVINQIMTYLGVPQQRFIQPQKAQKGEQNMPSYEYKADSGLSISKLGAPSRQGYYVIVEGVEKLNITDDQGNTNTDIGDMGFEKAVPGVSYAGGLYSDVINVGYHGLAMPAEEGQYTIKFRTGTDSIDIEVLKGVGNSSPNMAIRYIDLDLPPNVDCILTFNPQGVPDLAYDSNGDGTFDTVVPAHVRVTGTAAQDVTAPAVTLTYSKRTGGSGRVITINAADTQSGVQTVYYRIGETGSFKIYDGPFTVSAITEKVIEAFADDNVGNRSSPIRVIVPKFATFE